MKYQNGNILCLEYAELVPSIISVEAYNKARLRKNIIVHGVGGNGRTVLIEFETLPKKYKEAVKKEYGDPYQYIAQQPILDLINWDLKAEQFYRDYVLPATGLGLPDDYIPKYTNAASWLNTIGYLTTDKRALKANLNITIGDFWNTITGLIRIKNIHLPTSEKRLKEKLKAYTCKSGVSNDPNYGCMIEAFRFGNSNSKKVDDDIAEALLLEMISNDHQHDYTVIAKKYNLWAKEAGKQAITPGAVAYWAKKNLHLITQSREGVGKNYTKFVKYILRDRPSAPLLLVGSDDNLLDLYFKDRKVVKYTDKKTGERKEREVTNYYYRPALYVIMDAYNDYILGYAIGEEVTIDLIKAAYINAVHHIKELTQGTYLPHQIQMDRFGLDPKLKGHLAQYYKSIATTTPAIARASQGKYIERAFGVEWHQALKEFPNYSGQNITSKERLSPEAIDRSKGDFPTKEEASKYIELFINHLRKSRIKQWLTAFNESEKSKQKAISDEKRLQTFGYLHTDKTGKLLKNALTPAGLRPTIDNKELIFDIPEEFFPQHAGKQVQLIYDPYDLSKVLATDGKGLRFVAETYQKMPSALADYKEGDRTRLNNLIDGKKRIAAVPAIEKAKRVETLSRARIDAESLIQSGVLTKQIRQAAERAITAMPRRVPLHATPQQQQWPMQRRLKRL